MKKAITTIILLILTIQLAQALSRTGTTVFDEWSFANLSITPENAYSDTGTYEQEITLCNKRNETLRAYVELEYPEDINYQVQLLTNQSYQEDTYGIIETNTQCNDLYNYTPQLNYTCYIQNLTNTTTLWQENCNRLSGNKKICYYNITGITETTTKYRQEYQNITTIGTRKITNNAGLPVTQNKCYTAKIIYTPTSKTGKWNATICISSSPTYDGTCAFKGIIDPSWAYLSTTNYSKLVLLNIPQNNTANWNITKFTINGITGCPFNTSASLNGSDFKTAYELNISFWNGSTLIAYINASSFSGNITTVLYCNSTPFTATPYTPMNPYGIAYYNLDINSTNQNSTWTPNINTNFSGNTTLFNYTTPGKIGAGTYTGYGGNGNYANFKRNSAGLINGESLLTFAGWVKLTAYSSDYAVAYAAGPCCSNFYFPARVVSNGSTYVGDAVGGAELGAYGPKITLNEWYFIVTTRNATSGLNTQWLYNSTHQKLLSVNFTGRTGTTFATSFTINGWEDQKWTGQIDEVQIYRTIITPFDMDNLYYNSYNGYTPPLYADTYSAATNSTIPSSACVWNGTVYNYCKQFTVQNVSSPPYQVWNITLFKNATAGFIYNSSNCPNGNLDMIVFNNSLDGILAIEKGSYNSSQTTIFVNQSLKTNNFTGWLACNSTPNTTTANTSLPELLIWYNNQATRQAYWQLSNVTEYYNNFNFTNTASVTFVNGKIGNGANYSNLSGGQVLSIANNMGITNGIYTTSVWVYPIRLPANAKAMSLSNHQDAGTDVEYHITLYNNSGTQTVFFTRAKQNSGNQEYAYTTALPLNTWTHLALTYDGSLVRAYMNGTLIGNVSASGNGASGSSDVTAQGYQSGRIGPPASNFDGHYVTDELAIFNRTLTANEISALYDNHNANPPPYYITNPNLTWNEPIVTNVTITPTGTLYTNNTLICNFTYTGTLGTVQYNWTINGTDIGINQTNITNPQLTGGNISCSVTLTNTIYSPNVTVIQLYNMTGTVKDQNAQPINNAIIITINQAIQNTIWGNTTTNTTGHWSQLVTQGNWTVISYDPSYPQRRGDIKTFITVP